jgi:hypothetical protein
MYDTTVYIDKAGQMEEVLKDMVYFSYNQHNYHLNNTTHE